MCEFCCQLKPAAQHLLERLFLSHSSVCIAVCAVIGQTWGSLAERHFVYTSDQRPLLLTAGMKAALPSRAGTQTFVRQLSSSCALPVIPKRAGACRGKLQTRAQADTEPKQQPTELEGASTDLNVIYERLIKVCATVVLFSFDIRGASHAQASRVWLVAHMGYPAAHITGFVPETLHLHVHTMIRIYQQL